MKGKYRMSEKWSRRKKVLGLHATGSAPVVPSHSLKEAPERIEP